MANPGFKKTVLMVATALVVIALFAIWANCKIHRIPIPKREKLADCTPGNFLFPLRVRYHEPYQFVLGVAHSTQGPLDFHGEIELRQATGVVARIPISSGQLTPCNWLDREAGLSGYILTWSRTNQGERLGDVLVRGQTYKASVSFSNAPPQGSSLWLSSIGRVGEQ
jgi:hypothetical protein